MGTARELDQWVKKMKCSGATGLDISTFPELGVGVDPSPVSEGSPRFEPLIKEEVQKALDGKEGEWEVSGHFLGGQKEGKCRVSLKPGGKLSSSQGNSDNGLEGRARLVFQDGEALDGFFKQGVLHGFGRYFDRKGRLRLMGQHRNGVMVGTCWRVVRGGGCVVGWVDREGRMTGCKLAYLYPDYTTALVGSFREGVMVKAVEAVVSCVVDDEAGMKVPVFSTKDRVNTRQIGDYDSICADMMSLSSMGSEPRTPDPYESRMVEVHSSDILGAREGLFARQAIEINTTVSFYNGSRARPEQFEPDDWETNNYKIFDPANMPHGTIDIPVWAQNTSSYCGSLAHKTNHSFLPNGQFVVYDHPKFGLIPCITTIADIEEGEEILVGYGYDLEESPDWYQNAWRNSPFSQQGVDYKDWLECTVRNPISHPARG